MKEFVIDTTLDTKGIEKGAVDTEKIINKMVNATENASKSMASAMNNALKEMVPTEEYAQLEDEFSKLEAKMQDIGKKMDRFVALGGKEDSKTYKGYIYDLERLSDEQDKVIFKMQTMEDNGTAFANKVVPPTKQLVETTKESAQNIEKEAVAQEKLNTSAKRGVKIFGDLGKTTHSGFVNMLKYALGISSIFTLFNKLRSAIGEGIKNLAQFNNGVNPVNTALSRLTSSLATLKNGMAAAFAPILTAIEPLLTKFINLLVKAANYVGMFFAYLTGQKTYTKAIAVNNDYAKSLGGISSNASKAAKALASFDEAEVLNKNLDIDNAVGGASGSIKDMFEVVDISGIFGDKGIGEWLKEQIENFDTEEFGRNIAKKLDELDLGGLILLCIKKAWDFVKGAYEQDPLIGSLFEFLGLSLITGNTKIALKITAITLAAVGGFNFGKELGKFLFGDDETYDGFTWEDFFSALNPEDAIGAFREIMYDVGEGITFVLDRWKLVFNTVLQKNIDFLKQSIKNITGLSVDEILENIQKKFEGMKNIANIVFSLVESTINGAIDIINKGIDSINSMKITLPEWWPGGFAGQTFGTNIPNIKNVSLPRLASGTVVPRQAGEFAAILGDNKRETEVVSPLSTMKEAVVEAISESGGIGTGDVYITAEGDLDALIRLLRLKITQEDKRVGKSYVKAGAL